MSSWVHRIDGRRKMRKASTRGDTNSIDATELTPNLSTTSEEDSLEILGLDDRSDREFELVLEDDGP